MALSEERKRFLSVSTHHQSVREVFVFRLGSGKFSEGRPPDKLKNSRIPMCSFVGIAQGLRRIYP
jgi:hypothetical protein